ncbi:MAG TPA: acetylglutamate kinase [Candidatus Omnitrophota bacterium]|mgnify:CR=1 FL=1|nr:acetylglutamate kinase [Candidatus Omnitrophota bacterium]
MENIIKKAGVLIEALPYIQAFRRKVFVIKFGGSILENAAIRKYIFEDLVFLSYVGIKTILVHGGGPHISGRLKDAGIPSVFHEGIRVTDKNTLKIVAEELNKLNEQIVAEIKALKGDVTGLKGYENIVYVRKKVASQDLGFVGQVTAVNQKAIENHLKAGKITVISPMGICKVKQPYNINADEVASAIATSMKAEKFLVLTNVRGVLRDPAKDDSLISTLTVDEIEQLKKSKVISSGMIPKVNSCVETLNGGVHKAHIIDARLQHAILLEIFTDLGVGTQIIKK